MCTQRQRARPRSLRLITTPRLAPPRLTGMRLWSISPDQLDRAALVAAWREGLLAQKVLGGHTRGYRSHPQLERFRATDNPLLAIATWLHGVADAADRRGYRFDRTRVLLDRVGGIDPAGGSGPGGDFGAGGRGMTVTAGQLSFEWGHLTAKVSARDAAWSQFLAGQDPRAHPMFTVVPGPIATWERAAQT